MVNASDYLHFPTREAAINLVKLRLPAKTLAIGKFPSRVSLRTYVGDLDALAYKEKNDADLHPYRAHRNFVHYNNQTNLNVNLTEIVIVIRKQMVANVNFRLVKQACGNAIEVVSCHSLPQFGGIFLLCLRNDAASGNSQKKITNN